MNKDKAIATLRAALADCAKYSRQSSAVDEIAARALAATASITPSAADPVHTEAPPAPVAATDPQSLVDALVTVALGQGKIEVGQGHHGVDRLPAILFGRNGAGKVGVETEGDRIMKPGECIAAITFENPESLDVVAEKLAELRARIWPKAPNG